MPRETKGFSVARCNETLGGRFMNSGEMMFQDMEVPEDHLLVKDVALACAGVYFRPGKIIQGSKNLGVGVRAYEESVKSVLEVFKHAVELHGGNGCMLDSALKNFIVMPPCICTWTAPWMSPSSRSSRTCSPRRRGNMRGTTDRRKPLDVHMTLRQNPRPSQT